MTTSAPRLAWVLALTAAAFAVPARAQTPRDSLGWHYVLSLGYVQTSGNTQLSTVNVTDKLTWRPDLRWILTRTGSWVYARTSGVESANQIELGFRADYVVGPRLTAFGLAGYEQDNFAGGAHRFEELVGISWTVAQTPRQVLKVDIGAGNTQQLTGGVSASYFIARIAPQYRYNLSGKAYLEEAVELLENLQTTGDLRVTSTTALVAPLSSRIAVRLGYLVHYVAQPPINAAVTPNVLFKKLDTTFTSGIQLSL